ncbi:plasmid pRiA4b ORF-3 family protein [Pseudonocardia sp. ICBG1293]|uniref:plasmid pRiA4b ORF-3 family protein n=1 Tax=Pseudonocardia sp. ICBG1293 TaxID=2844382 RepID=UPI001CCBAD70|nr:plasmid pRiA4b ORF-3 family protein [Pseudonocardia sp. ICBG1293]
MVAPRVSEKTKIFELEIVLTEVVPAVRRRVQVPGEVDLAVLHEVVQSVMGWTNSHLHEFEIVGRRYGIPDPDWPGQDVADETKEKLFRLVKAGDRFGYVYVYDFGDNWAHEITVEAVAAVEPGVCYPRCVAGQGACPPEDVGGIGGYEDFQAVLADPDHPDRAERLEWAGGPFDPHRFDPDEADRALEWLAWRPLAPTS